MLGRKTRLEKRIAELKEKLEEHERRIAKLENLFVSKPMTVEKKLSIREYLKSKNPKDDLQKTLAVGHYIEKYERMSSFNTKDLEKSFYDAKEKVPGNINDAVNKNIQKGYMMEAKEKKDKLKAWNLTNTGENFIDSNFQKEAKE